MRSVLRDFFVCAHKPSQWLVDSRAFLVRALSAHIQPKLPSCTRPFLVFASATFSSPFHHNFSFSHFSQQHHPGLPQFMSLPADAGRLRTSALWLPASPSLVPSAIVYH